MHVRRAETAEWWIMNRHIILTIFPTPLKLLPDEMLQSPGLHHWTAPAIGELAPGLQGLNQLVRSPAQRFPGQFDLLLSVCSNLKN